MVVPYYDAFSKTMHVGIVLDAKLVEKRNLYGVSDFLRQAAFGREHAFRLSCDGDLASHAGK